MTVTEIILYSAVALTGIVLSALFSGMETGIYMINRVRLAVRASQRQPTALRISRAVRNTGGTLSVLLIGTNASNYLASFGVAALLHACGLGYWSLIILEALVVTPLLFVFAETLPKELFRVHTDRWTYWFWPTVICAKWLFTVIPLLPTVHLVAAVVSRLSGARDDGASTERQRVSRLIKEGVATGVLSESQTTLADRALALRGLNVGNVMVPWREAATLPIEADHEAREKTLRESTYSRLPVVQSDESVLGVLAWTDLILNRQATTGELVHEAFTLTPQSPLLEALSKMRHDRRAMAIVVAPETNRPVGLVTLKDLVEPLTGKLAVW